VTTTINDETMRELLGRTRDYAFVTLGYGPGRAQPGADALVWEHGRRNFALRAEGKLAIVGPLRGEGDIVGIYIFDASVDEARTIMDEDPAVRAGLFTYRVYALRSFPGDCLPG